MKKGTKTLVAGFIYSSFFTGLLFSSAWGQGMEHETVSKGAMFEGWLSAKEHLLSTAMTQDIQRVRTALGAKQEASVSKSAGLKMAEVPSPKNEDNQEASQRLAASKSYMGFCGDEIAKSFKSGATDGAVVGGIAGVVVGGIVGKLPGAAIGAAGGAGAGAILVGGATAAISAAYCAKGYYSTPKGPVATPPLED